MDITITGRNIGITDRFRDYATEKAEKIEHLADIMDRPPLVLSPYDAELFGHWWYEGPEFLDYFVRKAVFPSRTSHPKPKQSHVHQSMRITFHMVTR